MKARNTRKLPEIRVPQVPDELLRALGHHEGTFCDLKTVFHCLRLDMEHWVGVAGDGANGGYEQFVWKNGLLTVSDVGWGCVEIALLKILQQEVVE